MIPFGEYLPDQPVFENPGVTNATNVYPSEIGYRPFPSFGAYSDAAESRVMGAIFLTDTDRNSFGYAGVAEKLYQLGATLTDVSKSGGYDALTTSWEFCYFNG